ncbi:Uncharacterised protein [Yersinia pseudotuberculosis]|nr:Uncharacterised protein [Yersinia pseudotuberculosis]CND49001.1 Uncharacterised protein [Yersinia pseudotuberculosis]CNG79519.1 Uncharacterised protein [Yersinia pseudotuberculosis]CNI48926.1 Uncharacterised protein [Yersinia pseudotuberculosis]CNK82173.1 Uncharacterised protein [Yersinia pseudotuberculosis]
MLRVPALRIVSHRAEPVTAGIITVAMQRPQRILIAHNLPQHIVVITLTALPAVLPLRQIAVLIIEVVGFTPDHALAPCLVTRQLPGSAVTEMVRQARR